MTKSEVKALTLETLKKVDPVDELPAFIKALKLGTFFKLMLGEITKETADAVIEAADEFYGG